MLVILRMLRFIAPHEKICLRPTCDLEYWNVIQVVTTDKKEEALL
eukprot:IDg8098t1